MHFTPKEIYRIQRVVQILSNDVNRSPSLTLLPDQEIIVNLAERKQLLFREIAAQPRMAAAVTRTLKVHREAALTENLFTLFLISRMESKGHHWTEVKLIIQSLVNVIKWTFQLNSIHAQILSDKLLQLNHFGPETISETTANFLITKS
ncbi:MAG: hypothetical protein JKY54_17865 [Flavobacteriales bacterium]|nr:hypothetical protein [Flavobacteriales bacterium]